jgi:tetratricopeptide (TPR) repeat protein
MFGTYDFAPLFYRPPGTELEVAMKSLARVLTLLFLSPTLSLWPVAAQQSPPPRKPALIRDTDKAEGKEEADTSQPKEFNPLLAAKNLKVGDFYFKKKNYIAAIQRYMEAIEYQPNFTEAYEALGRAYEKNGDLTKAINIYRDFIQKNPDSPKIAEFRTKLTKLEKK